MHCKDLESVCILGLGLLGGSLGMAVNRVWPNVRRLGYSHRAVTRQRALEAGTVDEVFEDLTKAVANADMVVLASPIGTFANIMQEMADHLRPGCIVTDVGSTKVLVTRWAKQYLKGAEFLGSHPMAGSEQRGVDFARADLFEDAACIITPTAKTQQSTCELLDEFWTALGMRVSRMSPAVHDKTLARISHLPHVLAAALVNMSDAEELLLCGKGFLDTTRIASGPAGVWHDILMTNADNTDRAIGKLIDELQRVRVVLQNDDGKKLTGMLERARVKRDDLVAKKLRRKELPA
ncbi:MAG: prephenate dehydrogenase [Sedimentisphaerales bacterium]|nr:prephenate dehydrogenase [Sedimentisphaerales bacterium]